MKVVGVNGSPRENGNTASMIKRIFSVLESKGVECEFYQLGGKMVRGCNDCGWCKKNHERRCFYEKDCINEIIGKMADADGVLLGSPTYFASLTPEMKALIDRGGRVCRGQKLLYRKPGAAVVSVRRSGSMNVFQSINAFFLIQEMIVPGSSYWNMTLAAAPGDFDNDAEGIGTADTLGENFAWLLGKLA